MAVCEACNQEMTDESVLGCLTEMTVGFPDGTSMPAVPYDNTVWASERCHDCYCCHGKLHHPGCDVERCPRCGGQLISCGCLDEEEYEYEDGERPLTQAELEEWRAFRKSTLTA